MQSIHDWARSLPKDTRNKPSLKLQDDLIKGILDSIREGDSYADAVKALTSFGATATDRFYQTAFPVLTPKEQQLWTDELLAWADGLSNSASATIRFVVIFKVKLQSTDELRELPPELCWIALHEDPKTCDHLKNLRNYAEKQLSRGEVTLLANLRKLLSPDISDIPTDCRPNLLKYYGILFSNSSDTRTLELYRAFLRRMSEPEPLSSAAVTVASPDDSAPTATEAPVSASAPQDTESAATPPATETALTVRQPAPAPDVPCSDPNAHTAENTQSAQPSCEDLISRLSAANEEIVSLKKRVKEAETLAGSKEKELRKSEKALHEAETDEKRHLDDISALRDRLEEAERKHLRFEDRLQTQAAEADELRREMSCLRSELEQFRCKAKELDDTVGRVQRMADNSSRQELDGFKSELSKQLGSVVTDMNDMSGFSDAERADIYRALLEDMLDVLTHNGIRFEV